MRYYLLGIIFLFGCSPQTETTPDMNPPQKGIVYTYPYPAYCSSITIHISGVMECSQDVSEGKTLFLHILGPLECHNGLVKSKKNELYCL